jgi:hypothetical protein
MFHFFIAMVIIVVLIGLGFGRTLLKVGLVILAGFILFVWLFLMPGLHPWQPSEHLG